MYLYIRSLYSPSSVVLLTLPHTSLQFTYRSLWCCESCARMSGGMDHILHGPVSETQVPRVALGDFFLDKLQQYDEKVALVQYVDGVDVGVTYAELLRRSKCVAGLLRRQGLGPGDTVMLCCSNNLEYPAIFIGTLFVGASLAPVYQDMSARDHVTFIEVHRPQTVIVSTAAEGRVREALSQSESRVPLITMATVDACWAPDSTHDAECFHLASIADPDEDVAVVLCSSGTSGSPKAVEFTHFRVLAMMYCDMYSNCGPEEDLVYMNNCDPFWITCLLTTMMALGSGSKILVYPIFQEETCFAAIQQYKVNHVLFGPRQVLPIARSQLTERYDLSSLKNVVVTGAPMSQHYIDKVKEKLGCPVAVSYGMTESVGNFTPEWSARKPGTMGRLGANKSAKVIDPDSGKPLGANCNGELCVRSLTSFKCYRGNPRATRDMFDEDGFLHTGDMAYYDEEGWFYVVGRCKENFKYRCVQVPHMDIEEALLQHPAVLQVAVVGVPHEEDCAHARAFVVLRQGATATELELVTLVQETQPSYKWLHGGVRFLDALPRTPSGKIQRNRLLTETA